MQFHVVTLYVKGQLLGEVRHTPPMRRCGSLEITRERTLDGEDVEKAYLFGELHELMLPPLLYPHVVTMSSSVMKIRGFEELKTTRGRFYVRQEWLCRPYKGTVCADDMS